MPNTMQNAAAWLGANLQAAAGRTIVLSRGAQKSSAITGTVAMQDYSLVDENGFATTFTSYDWTFVTDDLPWEVTNGHRIRETLNGEVIEYEILPPPDRKAVEWLDTSGVLTLVHTKKVK